MRWLWGAIVTTALAALALAPSALASGPVYCVGEASCPGGTSLGEAGNGEQLQAALKKAGETPESTLLIGAGFYSRKGGFTYAGPAVTIRGASELNTVLSDEGEPGATVLTVKTTVAKAVAAVSSLAVQVPRPAPESKGSEQAGLLLGAGAQVQQVDVLGGGGVEDVGADIEDGASFTAGAIEMPQKAGEADGVVVFGGGRLSDCLVTGARAVVVREGAEGLALEGCIIAASSAGLEVPNEGQLLAEDSLIDMYDSGGTGVRVQDDTKSSVADATLRGLTIVGGADGVLVEAQTQEGAVTANALLEDSVVAETSEAVRASASAPAGAKARARAQIRYCDLDSYSAVSNGPGAEPALVLEEIVEKLPDFVSPMPGENGWSTGDWRPAAGSPLIDAGTPGPLQPNESTLDLEGDPRIVHGRRDIGAYEYQFQAPTVTASASPTTAATGQSVSFAGSAQAVEPGDSIASYQWTFDDGATVPAGASASHAFTTPGTHTATLTVTDAAGVQASQTVQVQVTVPPSTSSQQQSTSPQPQPPSVSQTTVGGVAGFKGVAGLTALAVHPSRFKALRHGTSVVAPATRGGALVTFTLSNAALVQFTPERLLAGVMRGARCVAAAPGAHGRRCVRRVALLTFSRKAAAGADSLRFSGRVAGRSLAPGSYVLVARAATSTLSAPFTIVK
jgi:PKD domain